MEAKTIIINKVIMEMERILSQDQLDILYNVLTITLYDCEISECKNEIVEYDDYDRFLCEQYYAILKVEGKSEKTIERYMDQLRLMMEYMQKPLKDIDSKDILYYLALYQKERGIANSTLDGMCRCISAFYSWAEFAGYIEKSPARRITHLVDRGMPLQDVQELAGHTSINTTRSYYRNTLENVKHSYLKAAQ